MRLDQRALGDSLLFANSTSIHACQRRMRGSGGWVSDGWIVWSLPPFDPAGDIRVGAARAPLNAKLPIQVPQPLFAGTYSLHAQKVVPLAGAMPMPAESP